jgi:hypothetical protein
MKSIFYSLLFFISTTLISLDTRYQLSLSQLHNQSTKYPENTYSLQSTFLSLETVQNMLAAFLAQDTSLKNKAPWVNQKNQHTFTHVQELIVPEKSRVFLFGDLHGKLHSLLRLCTLLKSNGVIDDNFQIKTRDTYLVFLGDYVDRGIYGTEVIYTLMRLKLANPDKVILVRGNHEDCSLNDHYGFSQELHHKYGAQSAQLLIMMNEFYKTLPAGLYLGCANADTKNFVLCCHGGLEIGFNAKQLLATEEPCVYQWLNAIERREAIRTLPTALKQAVINTIPEHEIKDFSPEAPTKPVNLGFLWNDFVINSGSIVDYLQGRGCSYGKDLTRHVLLKNSTPQASVRGVIRAHQHYGHMLTLLENNQGLVNTWNGMVYTLLSAPVNSQFSYDACTLLTTAAQYEEWTLQPLFITR